MNKNQSLIIYKFPSLFSILDEIKSYLNFNIINFNEEKFNENSIENNFVIISGDDKSDFQNQINLDLYPISIRKLIEVVNIQLLKNKFNQQNKVKVGKYYINLNSRKMNYKELSLPLTEKEVKIIIFLNTSKLPVNIKKLQSEVWGYKSKLETHTVETHVYRLRKKIERKFKDQSFIISSKNGYQIKT